MRFELDGAVPETADDDHWIAPTAVLIGKVRLERDASVWWGAVLRGDNEPITVGQGSNVQDNCVLHTDPGFPLTIGARVTVGHQAILHGCTIADDCLIGMGAKILNGAVLESECLVGAGALITEGKHFERGSLIVGSPARVVRQLTDEEKQALRVSAAHYAEKAARYAAELR